MPANSNSPMVKYDLGNKTGMGAVLSRAWLHTVNAEQPRLEIHRVALGNTDRHVTSANTHLNEQHVLLPSKVCVKINRLP